MTWLPCSEPTPGDPRACALIETIIIPRSRDLGGFEVRRPLVLRPGDPVTVGNSGPELARFVLVGGETMDGPRHIWWNFVSSRKERIEQAKAEWKARRFDTVSGDTEEFIPLPGEERIVRYP